ncbi:Thoc3, partial [Symbiodinium sp. KB8]
MDAPAAAAGAGDVAAPPALGTVLSDTPLLDADVELAKATTTSFTLSQRDPSKPSWNVNGTCLAAGLGDGTVNVLLADAASPERLLLSGGKDQALRVWDMRKLAMVHRQEMSAPVMWCDVAPDGLTAAVGVAGAGAKVLDLRTHKILHSVPAPAGVTVNSGAYDAEGNLVMVGVKNIEHGLRQGGGWLVHGTSGELVAELLSHSLACRSVAFDHSRSLLAMGSLDATVSVWDYAERSVLRTLDRPMCVDPRCVPPAGRCITTVAPFRRLSVDALAWSPGGSYLALASAEAPVEIVRVLDGTRVRCLEGTNSSSSVAWAPQSALLAMCSRPDTLLVVKG